MNTEQENSPSISFKDIPYVQSECVQNDQQKSLVDSVVGNEDVIMKQKRTRDNKDNRLEEGEAMVAESTAESAGRNLMKSDVDNEDSITKQKRTQEDTESRPEEEVLSGVKNTTESSEKQIANIIIDSEGATTKQKRRRDDTESRLEEGEVLAIKSSIESSETNVGVIVDNEGIATRQKRPWDNAENSLEKGELLDVKSNTEPSGINSTSTIVNIEENISKRRKFCEVTENVTELGSFLDVNERSGSVGKGTTNIVVNSEENIIKKRKLCNVTDNKVKVGSLLCVQNSEKSISETICDNINIHHSSSDLRCTGNESNDSVCLKTAVNGGVSLKTNDTVKGISAGDTQSQVDSVNKGENKSLSTVESLNDERNKGNSQIENKEKSRVRRLSLIPENRNILSDYNLMLAENIELFEVPTVYNIRDGADSVCTTGLPTSKVGLRCIHCSSNGRQVTAASFFPSSIGSIASGVGTIGARHFIGGKCPNMSNDKIEIFKQNKKTSQQQTRTQARVGLDAYCRVLSKRMNINNLKYGGIHFSSVTSEMISRSNQMSKMPTQKAVVLADDKKESDSQKRKANINTNDVSAFIEGEVENFWECRHCNSLPYYWRASGSVIFSAEAPSCQLVEKHLSVCQGKTPLCIPRNATIMTKESESGISIVIRWEHQDKTLRKSDRIQRKLLASGITKKRRTSFPTVAHVNENVENKVLALPEDKSLTTDFAYFTVQQLKKCYLTKPGGSRGNCPLGYPGLACSYCVGTSTPRRFFYTSADHLRNSFSHIPSHLAVCPKCPNHVKQKLEKFKETRSRQKSQLKLGEHKQFIDRLWGRLHGPDGGVIDTLQDESRAMSGEASEDDSSVSSLSMDLQSDDHCQSLSRSDEYPQSDRISIEKTQSILVFEHERKEVADYMFYSLLQMIPELVKNVKKKRVLKSGSEIKQLTNNQISEVTADPLKRKLESSRDDSVNSEKDENCEDTYTIVCRHCKTTCVQNQVFPTTADELRKKFHEIPKHLFLCPKCPSDVKEKLTKFKSLRASQEAFLKRGAQKKFLDVIWNRIERHFTDPLPPIIHDKARQSSSVGHTTQLVTDNDRKLVTQFTFFTMEQMIPCSLEKSGNGSRSMFQYGFPGLSCRHCTGTPSARKFFYRTADILSGNYAHIPNHVLSCKHCPSYIKKSLAEKKKIHANEKMRLQRGSQRVFFNNVWDRLHSRRV